MDVAEIEVLLFKRYLFFMKVEASEYLEGHPSESWNGRDKLVAGTGTSKETPNSLQPEWTDPGSGSQYLGVRNTVCQTNAGNCHQTILKVIQVKH